MTTAEIVRRLLFDAAGEAICDACLAFACSVRLAEMHEITGALLTTAGFQRRDWCVSCRRRVPAIASAKCAHCSRPILPGEDGLEINGDIFHAVCLRRLSSDETIRMSRKLSRESRRLIEESRHRLREQGPTGPAA
jgi:hypothetical protein